MSEPEQKSENNASFKQYTLKLFIAFKMAYSCCFSFGGHLNFPEFLQKSFITSTYGQTAKNQLPVEALQTEKSFFLQKLSLKLSKSVQNYPSKSFFEEKMFV